ncbi:MAG: ribbon-helix-helix domain-containing protein [Sulfurovum sp.]|nr:ribbon-helix-helix domain-containing protein [Sulfurovum sp.]
MGIDEIDGILLNKKKKITTSLTIEPMIYEEFTKLAKKMKVSKSKIIEQLIVVYMDSKKK